MHHLLIKSTLFEKPDLPALGARLLALTLLLLSIFAISGCTDAEQAERPPLEGAQIGGSFDLIDQNGQAVKDTDFTGQYRIMYFGYSYCPDVCPIDLQKLMQGFALFEKEHPERAKAIQPVFITIDPDRDTPEVMKQYVAAFHPRLIGLTGSAAQIADVAGKFIVVYQKQASDGASEYLVDHSRQAFLIGPDGAPLALLPYDETPRAIADEIDRWTR